MKHFTFLIFFMFSVLSFGQSLPIDFEDGTTVPAFQFGGLGFGNIENPDNAGPVNTSSRVLEVNKPDAAEWFGGIGFQTPGVPLVDFNLSTEITFKIWTPKANLPVRVRVQGDINPANEAYGVDVVVTTANTWQEVTVDFGGIPGVDGNEQFSELVIYPDFDPDCELPDAGCTTIGTGNGAIYFFDDIVQPFDFDPEADARLSDLTLDGTTIDGFAPGVINYDVELPNGTTTAPTVAAVATQNGSSVMVMQASGVPGSARVDVTAPNGMDMRTYTVNFTEASALPPAAPTPSASEAISLISDAYTNVNIPQVDVFGGTLTNVDLNTDGNDEALSLIDGSGFQYNFFAGTFLDISEANFMHLDFYAEGLTDNDILRIRLISPGPSGDIINIARVEFSAAQAGTWVSVDLEIPDGTNRNDFGDLDSSPGSIDLNQLGLVQFNTLDLGSSLNSKLFYLSNIYFYSDTNVSTNEQSLRNDAVQIFPNPVSAGAEVLISEVVRTITIFDLNGRVLRSSNQSTISTAGLTPGTYFLQIRTLQDEVAFKRLIIK